MGGNRKGCFPKRLPQRLFGERSSYIADLPQADNFGCVTLGVHGAQADEDP